MAVSPRELGVPGPPPLEPFGLRLHHDGRWTHEGHPILNRKLRELFDRSVVYLPEEGKYVTRLHHFRGEVEVEEAGFFVRDVDLRKGRVHLSDRSTDVLVPETLSTSPIDGAVLCQVKHELVSTGLKARFSHAAQAELFAGVLERPEGWVLEMAGRAVRLPDLE